MRRIIQITNPREFLKKYMKFSYFLNLLIVCIATVYYLGVNYDFIGHFLGFLFIFSFIYNLGLVIYSDKLLNKKELGSKGLITHYLTYVYLLFLIIAVWGFFYRKGAFLFPSFNIIMFYSIFGFSILIIPLNFSLLKIENEKRTINPSRIAKKILKVLIFLFVFGFFFICFFLAWGLLTGGPPTIGIATGTVISFTSGLFFLCVPVVTILIYRVIPRQNYKKTRLGFMMTGFVFTIIFTLPFISVPFTIIDANAQFEESFGPNWNEFDPNVQQYFLDTPFVLGQYYFGIPEISDDNYNFKSDILFANHSDYELRFDVYYPKKTNLPCSDATIIYIHGGGWCAGDKGQATSFLKRLAMQGYVIFDIQYRLLNISLFRELAGFELDLGTPGDEKLIGWWTIEDMVSDIANFTRYIYLNNVFGANLQNVIFMGGSAGAHLAAVSSFGYNSGFWNFSPWLNITGVGLFFPPNSAEDFFYDLGVYHKYGFIPGNDTPAENPAIYAKYTPSELVDADDPPCIIFHGTSDSLVPYNDGVTIQVEMKSKDNICILVKGYWGAHGHIEAVHYGTVAMYYLERFLYLIK